MLGDRFKVSVPRSTATNTMVEFDLTVSAFAPLTASMIAASITQPLQTGVATAFADLPTLSLLVPGDYTVRIQPTTSKSRRDLASDDLTTCAALQQLLDEGTTAHAEETTLLQEEKATLQAAYAALSTLLDTASEEKAVLAQLLATTSSNLAASNSNTPWLIAIASIQVCCAVTAWGVSHALIGVA